MSAPSKPASIRRQNTLGRVLGLGSAKAGSHHWVMQRLTAVALVPLSIWFTVVAVSLTGADYGTFIDWQAQFGNLVLMILFIGALFYHAQSGVQVVIEDYVSCKAIKVASIVATRFVAALGAVACWVAVVLVAVQG